MVEMKLDVQTRKRWWLQPFFFVAPALVRLRLMSFERAKLIAKRGVLFRIKSGPWQTIRGTDA